jgi:fermentation-respiration switch protein FrsA (DUF1100 family)
MRRMIEFLTILAIGYAGLVGALYVLQRELLFLPDASRPSLGEAGLAGFMEVVITTGDGLSLFAWYHPAPEGAPTVLYLHGNGGHIGYRAERAKGVTASGFGILLVEYRGYGGNPGAPSERGFHADAMAALAFLDARGIPRSRIVIVGESLGTAVAVRVAAESAHPVGALVLEAPFTSVADLAQHHYPFVPARWLVKDRFDAVSRVTDVRTPVLVLHGGRDDVIPQHFGRALFAAAHHPKQGLFIDDADHSNAFAVGFSSFLEFIRQHLRVDANFGSGALFETDAPQPIGGPIAEPRGVSEDPYDDEAPQTA